MNKTMPGPIRKKDRIILLGSVFIVAACGLVYELVAGAVASYILGDAVTQFSLVIGVFLCAMGIGAYLAKMVTRRLLETFIEVEIWIGLIGGGSSIIMFAVSAFADPIFPVIFYLLCSVIGIMIGIEIPLLIRILKEKQDVSEALSNVLALDYVGALAGSLAFPLLALPYLGLSRSSTVFGLMNLIVAAIGARLIRPPNPFLFLRIGFAFLLLVSAFFYSNRMVGFLEDLLYQDNIIYKKDTPYQRIVLTRWREDVRLYLNGHIQFCSVDEARYHESLVIPAMSAHPHPKNILVLGGGDGLAIREVLKFRSVEKIDLVDIDPAMTDLGKHRPELAALNKGALLSPLVAIHNVDAMNFVDKSKDFFDVIIIDLPDPHNQTLCKLYSHSFYSLCARRLSAGGLIVTQATSPFYAPEAFRCIEKTMGAAGPVTGLLIPKPYHVNVPSFGEWGFVMAGFHPVYTENISIEVPTRFLNPETLKAMFYFSKDMSPKLDVEVNRLDHPVLYRYYEKGWLTYND